MNEDFLYYVWQYKLFSSTSLSTSDGLKIHIKKAGTHNKNEGPDFLNAHIELDNQLWVGNVEMHLKSSDWYLHKHEEDVNYDAVILHVVWDYDADIFMKNNKALPTLELKNVVENNILLNYKSLIYQKQNWIPCENQIDLVDGFLVDNWLERLYFERLEQKSTFIKELLNASNYDFEAVLFQLIAKNFGLKINGDAFLQLAKSIDFSVVRKVRFDENKLTALFFGQAGFLEDEIEDSYDKELKKEYEYLKHKHQLKPISKNTFQFFRMRPQNFPTIRIAQLAALFFTHQNLFSRLMSISKNEDFYEVFNFGIQEFWQTHYTFEKSSKKSSKKLTKAFIDLILINTILPLKFVYLNNRNEFLNDDFLKLIKQIKPEKNSVISKFSDLKIGVKNAMDSQALLTLKNNYCTKKRCLQCAIGNTLLRK
ncbi:DUF2851 family protein [Polaribacter sp. Asnod6-C07]|uniref:DUF2851 family protein n=1 Tax=Polaribacter sp. Asnod6-C07 TaxID=3160582 RepID=UPI00386AD263